VRTRKRAPLRRPQLSALTPEDVAEIFREVCGRPLPLAAAAAIVTTLNITARRLSMLRMLRWFDYNEPTFRGPGRPYRRDIIQLYETLRWTLEHFGYRSSKGRPIGFHDDEGLGAKLIVKLVAWVGERVSESTVEHVTRGNAGTQYLYPRGSRPPRRGRGPKPPGTKGAAKTLEAAMLEPFVTVDHLCRVLDCTRKSIWERRKAGEIPPAVQISPTRIGWPRGVIDSWLASLPIVDVLQPPPGLSSKGRPKGRPARARYAQQAKPEAPPKKRGRRKKHDHVERARHAARGMAKKRRG
jgi:predicted DNA-binding transcriptional regulator AlpA